MSSEHEDLCQKIYDAIAEIPDDEEDGVQPVDLVDMSSSMPDIAGGKN